MKDKLPWWLACRQAIVDMLIWETIMMNDQVCMSVFSASYTTAVYQDSARMH